MVALLRFPRSLWAGVRAMGTASGVADNGLAALGSRHGTRERDTKSLPSFLPSEGN